MTRVPKGIYKESTFYCCGPGTYSDNLKSPNRSKRTNDTSLK